MAEFKVDQVATCNFQKQIGDFKSKSLIFLIRFFYNKFMSLTGLGDNNTRHFSFLFSTEMRNYAHMCIKKNKI